MEAAFLLFLILWNVYFYDYSDFVNPVAAIRMEVHLERAS